MASDSETTGRTPRAVPPQLTPWKPGQSGNPGGRSKEMQIVQEVTLRVLAEGVPRARARLLELIDSSDEKIALAACRDVLDRVIGKAPDAPEDREARETSAAEMLSAIYARGVKDVTP